MVRKIDDYPEDNHNTLSQISEQRGGYTMDDMSNEDQFEETDSLEEVHPKDISKRIEASTTEIVLTDSWDFE
jgi:hypothetical protein